MTWPGVLLVLCVACSVESQSAVSDDASQPHLVIRTLSPVVYPPAALAARVAGKVDLKLVLRRDGTIESVDVVDGPGLLRAEAVQSARRGQFECGDCTEPSTPLHLIYRFELGPFISCSNLVDDSYPKFSHSKNVVSIAAQPHLICDPGTDTSTVRKRGWRCGFLWKCGWRKVE